MSSRGLGGGRGNVPEALDVALVNQPIDSVVPPVFNSLGLDTHELATRLVAEHRVRVFAGRSAPGHQDLPDAAVLSGVQHHFVPDSTAALALVWPYVGAVTGPLRGGLRPQRSNWAGFGYGYVRGVARRLEGDQPQIIHVRSASQFLPVLGAACPDAALILSVHAAWHAQAPVRALRRRLAWADAVLACSRHVADSIVRAAPEHAAKVHVVYDGVASPRSLSARRQLAGDRTNVLFVGALASHKGVHDLIQAFVELARAEPSARLRLVGSPGNYPREEVWDLGDSASRDLSRRLSRGDYLTYLRSLVPPDLQECIEFAGPLHGAELARAFADADILVSPTVGDEGFGRPVIEAMAAGVAVIASRSGGQLETVQDGVTGILVDRGAPDQLATALRRLAADPQLRRRMGIAGARAVRRFFEWDLIARQTTDIYRAAVDARAARLPVDSVALRSETEWEHVAG